MNSSLQSIQNTRESSSRAIRLRASADASAVFFIDTRGIIAQANVAALRLLGCEREQAIGLFYGRFLKILHATTEAESSLPDADPVVRCLAAEEPCMHVYGFACGVNGAANAIEATVAPTYNEHREVVGAVVITSID